MKRSEMLRIIWESINELEDAEHILTKIEQAGMLPPSTDWLVVKRPGDMQWSQVHDFHFWEPENEEK